MSITRGSQLKAYNNNCLFHDRLWDGISAQRGIQCRSRSLESLKTVVMPSSLVEGKIMFSSLVENLKKIEGVKGVSLFFKQTALRVYFDPAHTDLHKVQAALQTSEKERFDKNTEQSNSSDHHFNCCPCAAI